jgi:hypothetical protein
VIFTSDNGWMMGPVPVHSFETPIWGYAAMGMRPS